jgi:hypothetical protein
MANGVQTFEIDFNVDYRTVGRTDSLFKWKNRPFVRTGSLFSGPRVRSKYRL